ncbi:MAG: nucleotidyl transferase [Cyanobacteria bacterium DS3.002]|nr:nucleotidyl transferase [Cyanobacteria bacterium DS3.002]MBA4049759.1 nucleotidyl transferase [Cyanobacteria bacterium DS2.008]MBA4074638.1 nucleotidyl transferase [Cyanobacteria bacterium PR.023]
MRPPFPPVLILSGGLGTRLGPLASNIPKAMVKTAGEPFVAHQLRLLKRRGVNHVVLCTGHLGEEIENFVQSGEAFGLRVDYCRDAGVRLGTGGSIKAALKAFPNISTFALTYGDSYLDIDLYPPHEAFTASGKEGLMTVFHNCNRYGASNVRFADGLILRYEKGASDLEHIDFGFSFLRRESFDVLEGEVFDLNLLWQSLIARNQLVGYPVSKRFFEIGTAEGLAECEALIMAQAENNGA